MFNKYNYKNNNLEGQQIDYNEDGEIVFTCNIQR